LLQRTGHQAILGFDRLVLPFGALGFMGGPFQTLTPLAVQALPLLLNMVQGLQA
jgi:hypothetical protein